MENRINEKIKLKNNLAMGFGIAVSILVAIITLLFGTGDSIIGVIILIGIFGFVVLFFLVSWLVSLKVSNIRMIGLNFQKINKIEKDLNNLEGRLDLSKDIAELKSRMSLFEKMQGKKIGKKGALDPRWIIILIILILLYLFLRQLGVF